jgi:hypothetical protein
MPAESSCLFWRRAQVVEGVAAAQEALELLIPAGDYAGALDILADLHASGAPAAVSRLAAFASLPQQLAGAAEARCLRVSHTVPLQFGSLFQHLTLLLPKPQ